MVKEPEKPKMLILEGADKVGKSTIYQALRRATAYKPLVTDRLFGSNMVYDRLYGRSYVDSDPYTAKNLSTTEKKMEGILDIFLVILSGQRSVIKRRIEDSETGNDKKVALANFEQADDLFREYLANSPLSHKRIIMTTDKTVDQVVQEILEFMDEPRRDDPGRKEFEN